MKFGLECEYFIFNKGQVVSVPTGLLPFDNCGFLVEARGKPYDNIAEAVHSVLAEENKLFKTAKNNGYKLQKTPVQPIPKELALQIRREFSKGVIAHENIYGYLKHNVPTTVGTAGLHISFTNPRRIYYETEREVYSSKNKLFGKKYMVSQTEYTVNEMFDFVRVFTALDKAFKEEIKNARRRPGFYELKSDGRIEYRSLPNNVSMNKVIDVIEEIFRGRI